MSIEQYFQFFNTSALIPWALLFFLPNWKGTQWMIRTKLPILIFAAAYLTFLGIDMMSSTAGPIDFSSFDSIRAAFGREAVMLVGWLHYLAFDLFVGMWELEDAQKLGIKHYLVAPCLFLTLMFGPVGFLLYWLLRTIVQRRA